MSGKSRFLLLNGLFAATMLLGAWELYARSSGSPKGEWPQWRGPNRDGISHETGLLKSWPEGGPKVLWRVPVGDGYSGISVSKGRAYTITADGDGEFVICLDASNGNEIWRFRSGSKFTESNGNGPRSTPTVGGDWVFALGAKGQLYSLDARYGKELWKHDLLKEFESTIPPWAFSTSPLVEGDLLLVEVGGQPGKSIVAFDIRSGRVAWTSHTDKPAYSSPIAITYNGIRQIVFLTSKTLLSVSPEDGQIYWKYPWLTHEGINVATPIFVPEDKIFISASYDKGAALVKVKSTSEGKFTVEEVWKNRVMKNHFNSSVLHGDYLYGFDGAILKCIRVDTAEDQWKKRGFGKGSLTLADGHLIILSDSGQLALAEATSSEYKEKASAPVLEGKCWTVPTLAGGKLYVRNQKEMVCLDMMGRN